MDRDKADKPKKAFNEKKESNEKDNMNQSKDSKEHKVTITWSEFIMQRFMKVL